MIQKATSETHKKLLLVDSSAPSLLVAALTLQAIFSQARSIIPKEGRETLIH